MGTVGLVAKPLCFIIMPFGKKPDTNGHFIDFDYIYNEFIKKVIEACGLSPIRADQEMIGGIIQKPMYERLVLCDYAIADLTTGNPNVFYELGVRFTAKPYTTFSIYESQSKPPFDLNDVRCFPYSLADGKIADLDNSISKLSGFINGVKAQKGTDSPVYQLLGDISFSHNLPHEKLELLRSEADFNAALSGCLDAILKSAGTPDQKGTAISELSNGLGDKDNWDVSVCIEILLAHRSAESYTEMTRFIETLPAFLKNSTLMREQYGFALNRTGRRDEAVHILQQVIAEKGANSETCGLLGRVYKDKYNEAKTVNPLRAAGFLDRAIDSYLDGYKADMRDFYPGINAATLLYIKKDPAAADLAKVVEFSVHSHLDRKSNRVASTGGGNYDDYWPYATLLELAVIQQDTGKAIKCLSAVLAIPAERWQLKTTADNLNLLAGETGWVKELATELLA